MMCLYQIKTKKSIINAGIELKFKDLKLGYGNWNNWWGPASHSSIVMSNNSEGFDHLYVQNKNTIKFKSKKLSLITNILHPLEWLIVEMIYIFLQPFL